MGDDIYPTATAKAAALLHSLLRVEALGERNRTFAWIVAMRYLRVNGLELPKLDPATAIEMLDATRRGETGVRDLSAWLTKATRDTL
ncbi:hypothetical protein Sme01_31180 [Sphaerisporangium melleum]|uniref:Fido domain-containing protein n=1 Tax=Sphaerisporangium melleum TaxID=321316 RepID=A0A917R994_9ACTN|nr:hypothetical protein [Sphaerisporangium melleum]GGK95753.1 hypothetical protein GCM10007964_42610 [Sphaerisporangium melleum]GII70642.1 hypothetical protein Sme01_31180 [Sphaerisporangium melleum]